MEFEINFLTQKKSTLLAEHVKRYRLPIMGGLLGVAVVLFVVFYGSVLTRKTSQVVTSGQEFVRLTVEKDKVASLVNVLRRVQDQRIPWTDKLELLSEATPDQVVLTSLDFKEVKSPGGTAPSEKDRAKLVLRGTVIPSGTGDPARSIQEFMEALKKSAAFMSGFENPVLVSVNNARNAAQQDTLEFEFHLFRKVQE